MVELVVRFRLQYRFRVAIATAKRSTVASVQAPIIATAVAIGTRSLVALIRRPRTFRLAIITSMIRDARHVIEIPVWSVLEG